MDIPNRRLWECSMLIGVYCVHQTYISVLSVGFCSISSQYPLLIGCHPFSPTNHLVIENHGSLIQISITPSMESTPGFFPSASPVMSRLTSSFTCQLISTIITTLIIHHSFTPTFSTNPSHLRFLLPTGLPSWQRDWTGPIMLIVLFLVSHFNFLFVPCGGLSCCATCQLFTAR